MDIHTVDTRDINTRFCSRSQSHGFRVVPSNGAPSVGAGQYHTVAKAHSLAACGGGAVPWELLIKYFFLMDTRTFIGALGALFNILCF